LPTVVVLEPASSRFEGVRLRDIAPPRAEVIEHNDLDGRHLVIRDHGELRVWMPHVPADQPLSVVIPIDEEAETRIKRALGFWHWITHPGSRITEPFPLTQQQRDRLILMLRVWMGISPRLLTARSPKLFLVRIGWNTKPGKRPRFAIEPFGWSEAASL
jgi:hypothetical protein